MENLEVHPADLMEIGQKLVNLADRVRGFQAITPGARGRQELILDGIKFSVTVELVREP